MIASTPKLRHREYPSQLAFDARPPKPPTRIPSWPRDRYPGPRLGVVAGAVAAGGLSVSHNSLLLALVAAAVALLFAAWIIPRRYRLGVGLSILTLGAINTLPGPDLSTTLVKSGFYGQDIVTFALIVLLLADITHNRLWRFYRTRIGQVLVFFSVLGAAWWLFTLYRSTLDPGIAVNHAANFGRDFLYADLLPPLFAASLQRKTTRDAVLTIAGGWSVVLAVIYTVVSLHADVTHDHLPACSDDQAIRRSEAPLCKRARPLWRRGQHLPPAHIVRARESRSLPVVGITTRQLSASRYHQGMSDDEQRQEAATTTDLSRQVATSGDSDYSLSIDEALARYEERVFPARRAACNAIARKVISIAIASRRPSA